MNFIFISPNFPSIFSHFVKSLKDRGVTVLGIGDQPFNDLNQELKDNLTEYCFCWNLNNIQWMKNTVDYLRNKYGRIDFIESNNEFWLNNDAILREYLGCDTGFYPSQMEKIKFKSKMKKYFADAGIKTARYILSSTFEASKEFVSEVGYPIFAKPDNGVGAASTFKIDNEDQLRDFHNKNITEPYILEEYIDAYIQSFDGICNLEGDVSLCVREIFPTPIDRIVKEDSDLCYFATKQMDESFKEMGKRVIKAFGISKRCFHIEFFVLKSDKPGLGKVGDIIGLEVNMRCPGGNTPDLISDALGCSYYDAYADIITTNKCNLNENSEPVIAVSVARKNKKHYLRSEMEIWNKYRDHIKEYGHYNPEIALAMGNTYFFATFKTFEEANEFQNFVREKEQ